MNELFFLTSLVFAIGGLQAWFLSVSLDNDPAAAFCAARGPACGDTLSQNAAVFQSPTSNTGVNKK